MKKRFVSFSPNKTGLTVALVMAIGSLLFVLPMALIMFFMPNANGNGQNNSTVFPGMFMLCMPIVYFIFGYIFTTFSAWVYNKVARFTGGIEFEVEESEIN